MVEYNLEQESAKLIGTERFRIILTTILINVLGLALPLMILQIYDRIIPNKSIGTASLLLVGVVTAVILESLMRWARSYLMARIGARFEHIIGCKAFERYLHSDYQEFEKIGVGEHIERFNAIGIMRDYFSGQAAQAKYDMPFAVLFLLVIVYLTGIFLILIPIILIVSFIWMVLQNKQEIEILQKSNTIANDDRYNFLIGVFSGLHSVKAMAMENLLYRRFQWLQEKRNNDMNDLDIATSRLTDLSNVLSQLVIASVVGVGALLVIQGKISIGGLVASTLLMGRIMQSFQNMVMYWIRLEATTTVRANFEKIFELPIEKNDKIQATDKILNKTLFGSIALQNISLESVFKDINIKIMPREMVAINGINGSGRTALLKIIRGILQPTSGQVILDNHELNSYHPSVIKNQIALISGQEELFKGTIMDNITMFRPELTEMAVAASILIGIDEKIKSLPRGYQTEVGNMEDDSIPRGLRQRIIIARALVEQPRVLLLDEANSADDQQGDEALKELLNCMRHTMTIVVVSHRPSVLNRADRIFDIKNQTVVERINASDITKFGR